MLLKTQVSALTDRGQKRNYNEDCVDFFEPDSAEDVHKSGCIYVVADGVGGASNGAVASQYATKKLLHEYFRHPNTPIDVRLSTIIRKAGNDIYRHAEESKIFRQIATTIVAAVVRGNSLIVANVGDSRAYLIRGGKAQQLTNDHTVISEMLRDGTLTKDEAKRTSIKNRITRSVGGERNVQVDIFSNIQLRPGDKLLLCSDGLTRYATKVALARIAEKGSVDKITNRLIHFANQRGGADNISAILIEFSAIKEEKVPISAQTEPSKFHPRPELPTPLSLEDNQVLRQKRPLQKIDRVTSEKSITMTNFKELSDLLVDLTYSLDYQLVQDTIINVSNIALKITNKKTDNLISAVFFSENWELANSKLQVITGHGLSKHDLQKKTPGREGILNEVIKSGYSQYSSNVSEDPELKHFDGYRACQSAYCIPLQTSQDIICMIVFAHPKVEYFKTEQREILDIISQHAEVALNNAKLFQEVVEEKKHLNKIREEERVLLFHQLNDGPVKIGSAISMQVSLANNLIRKKPSTAKEEFFKVKELSDSSKKVLRDILFKLTPTTQSSQGLTFTLNSMAKIMEEVFNQKLIIETDEELISTLTTTLQSILFTVAEESIKNACKHAQADHIWVRVKRMKKEFIFLEVKNDGKGFDLEDYTSRDKLGILNMKDHVEYIQGLFNIEAKLDKGTTIQAVIPLTDSAAERLQKIDKPSF